MKIALDPYMLRGLSFGEVCRIAAEIGYDAIELSPRQDFIPFFTHPRADRARVAEFRAALRATGAASPVAESWIAPHILDQFWQEAALHLEDLWSL